MKQELRQVFDQISAGALSFEAFVETFRELVVEEADKEVQEFDECLNYLVQPEIKV